MLLITIFISDSLKNTSMFKLKLIELLITRNVTCHSPILHNFLNLSNIPPNGIFITIRATFNSLSAGKNRNIVINQSIDY